MLFYHHNTNNFHDRPHHIVYYDLQCFFLIKFSYIIFNAVALKQGQLLVQHHEVLSMLENLPA